MVAAKLLLIKASLLLLKCVTWNSDSKEISRNSVYILQVFCHQIECRGVISDIWLRVPLPTLYPWVQIWSMNMIFLKNGGCNCNMIIVPEIAPTVPTLTTPQHAKCIKCVKYVYICKTAFSLIWPSLKDLSVEIDKKRCH